MLDLILFEPEIPPNTGNIIRLCANTGIGLHLVGRLGFTPDTSEEATAPLETLEALNEQVTAGKIRHVGLSNETPWGTMRFLDLAERHGLPRMQSIQNPYNLLNRSFEVGLAECAWREDCGLLAYSPLAGGTLTGKYLDGQVPPGTRRAIDHRPSRYDTPRGPEATRAYVDLARRHGVSEATIYNWKSKYGGLEVSEARRLRELESENAKLKRLLADTMLDNVALKDLLAKKF